MRLAWLSRWFPIPGHEFQFEFLADRPLVSAILGKSPGSLAPEFALTDIADIGANHEAEQMLGINALGANTARKSAVTHTNTARQIFERIGIHELWR